MRTRLPMVDARIQNQQKPVEGGQNVPSNRHVVNKNIRSNRAHSHPVVSAPPSRRQELLVPDLLSSARIAGSR